MVYLVRLIAGIWLTVWCMNMHPAAAGLILVGVLLMGIAKCIMVSANVKWYLADLSIFLSIMIIAITVHLMGV